VVLFLVILLGGILLNVAANDYYHSSESHSDYWHSAEGRSDDFYSS